MNREELLDRLQGPETGDFEVKAAEYGVPEDAYKTVSAFANTSGGWLVFGIREDGDRFEISGLKDPDRLQNDFLTTCRSSTKLSRPVDLSVKYLRVDDRHVLAFHVEELPRFDKPLRIRVKKDWQTFVRIGSGDHRCSEVEEARFLRDASYEPHDSTIYDAGIERLDVESMEWFRGEIAVREPRYRGLDWEPSRFLSMTGLLDDGRLTLAAVLLFGEDSLISRYRPVGIVDFRLIWRDRAQAPPEYRWDDRIFCDRNLATTLRILTERFYRLSPQPFEMESNGLQHRAESRDYLAVREALVNLLAHQDYTDKHRVATILWYRDRVTFENPGDSYLTARKIQSGGTSSPRNPKLLQLLRQGGFAEQAGEGVREIFQTWKRANRPRPEIENEQGEKLYRLTLPWPDQGRPPEESPRQRPEQGRPAEPSTGVQASPLPGRPSPVISEVRSPHPVRTSTARLPITGDTFIGRTNELARLDAAWDDPDTNVISFVAMGGGGKSALVNRWIDRLHADGWRGAERVLGWSFYSQGTDAIGASSEAFTEFALRWLGYEGEPIVSPWQKGEEIARLVRAERTLLVLDGLEPLQHPPGAQTGRIKDPAVQALVRELAVKNPGLCVITTRLPVADVTGRAGTVTADLEQLTPEAGAELLGRLGVEGTDDELRTASTELGGHVLALTLLGTYLRDVCHGDIRQRNKADLLDEDIEGGAHARRMMASYAAWLGPGTELRVLHLLGLFDRPAEAAALDAVRAEPEIPGLTEGIGAADETAWRKALARLQKARLVAPTEDDRQTLDAHPLVRTYFGERLRETSPEAWRAGHERLREYDIALDAGPRQDRSGPDVARGPGCPDRGPGVALTRRPSTAVRDRATTVPHADDRAS